MSSSFIVIDGIDGVGKTTVALQLAKRIDGIYFKMPPSIFEEFYLSSRMTPVSLRAYIDGSGNPQLRFLFYLMCTAEASTQIRELLKQGNVVCDRYLASTLAYHYALDPTLKRFNWDMFDFVLPDVQILLTAKEDIRRKRIYLRHNLSATDLSLEANYNLLVSVGNEFGKLDMIKVDTSEMSAEEVVSYIIERILSPNGIDIL